MYGYTAIALSPEHRLLIMTYFCYTILRPPLFVSYTCHIFPENASAWNISQKCIKLKYIEVSFSVTYKQTIHHSLYTSRSSAISFERPSLAARKPSSDASSSFARTAKHYPPHEVQIFQPFLQLSGLKTDYTHQPCISSPRPKLEIEGFL